MILVPCWQTCQHLGRPLNKAEGGKGPLSWVSWADNAPTTVGLGDQNEEPVAALMFDRGPNDKRARSQGWVSWADSAPTSVGLRVTGTKHQLPQTCSTPLRPLS